MEQLKQSAKDFLATSDFVRVIETLELYLEQKNDDIEVLEMLGDAHKGLNQNEAMLEAYTNALSLNPAHLGLALKLSNATLDGVNYIDMLKSIHENLKPKSYIEIGVCKGVSFQLADPDCLAIGIDPEPQLAGINLPSKHTVLPITSDDYFATEEINTVLKGEGFDLAFLDGMHQFEFALRDFINLERYANAHSMICIHDLYPLNAATATRERVTDFWSGDVWKLALCLTAYRPDLEFFVLPCPPTGLGVVRHLNPNSTVLKDHYDEIVAKYTEMSFEVLTENKAETLSLVARDYLFLDSDQ